LKNRKVQNVLLFYQISQGINMKSVENHFDPKIRPKRILTLDGGGVRGMLTLSFLKEIEKLLKSRYNNPDFKLSDYFDLIAGTSTGAIIASMLSLGWPVGAVQDMYRNLAKKVFKPSIFRWGLLRARFNEKALEDLLKNTLGQRTLGQADLQTGLMVMAKRMDTGSLWQITNSPYHKYFKYHEARTSNGYDKIPNADLLLWCIVRASTAAPYYFEPERLLIGTGERGEKLVVDFVDGGVSTANNPALQALQFVTLEGFNLKWQTGVNNLLLISVGTGLRTSKREVPWLVAGNAVNALMSIIDDCNDMVETMMQWIAATDTPRAFNSDIGGLYNDQLAREPLLTYQRYNVELNSWWLKSVTGKDYTEEHLKTLQKMEDPKNVSTLETIGNLAAKKLVVDKHFPVAFD
jgi:hypothetical protein